LNAILARWEGVADIDSGGSLFDKEKYVPNVRQYMLESFCSDNVHALKGGFKPQVKGVIGHSGKQDETTAGV
jgi:hypothetical protein